MSCALAPSIVLSDVGLTWPDGSTALTGLTASLRCGRTGLVGLNGSGKSTLLRLIAGDLRPSSGTITTTGQVALLPQTLSLHVGARVADLLGIGGVLDAVRAIEAGDVDDRHFEAVGADWDVQARAGEVLAAVGLPPQALDRHVGELSGGEAVLAAIAGLRLRAAPITLLDEPTNNLDRAARGHLAALVTAWRGALVVVSHDRELLELMDETAELHDGVITVVAGPYSTYRAHVQAEQAAAQQGERSAEQVLRRQRRQRVEAETILARRLRYAKNDHVNKRKPKIVMNQRRTEAQVSAGKLRGRLNDDITAAREALTAASARVRDDATIRLQLPDPDVPSGRRLAELHGTDRTVVLQGPERVALTGPNGVGKTTLLRALLSSSTVASPPLGTASRASARPVGRPATAVAFTERIGYLAQRLDDLDDSTDVLEQVRAAAPNTPPQQVRSHLARFLLRGDDVHRRVGTLSGGERFRVALARLLLADPPPQLLVLDEPTNDLDLHTSEQLVTALSAYRGCLLVVSHDDAFLHRLGITTRLALDREGRLLDVGGPAAPAVPHLQP